MFDDLAARVLHGEVRACARLISALENGEEAAFRALAAFSAAGALGRAQIVGVTGPPGSGKSTLTDKMIGILRARGLRVAVIAVDPSSPFSGGAILGDRLRMQGHATDPGVFIRSLASRGTLGGLSEATHAGIAVLDAAGYDIVIVETVGVGQSEVDILRVADTVVLVSVPGLGDDIQVIKAGIMEIGDIFVVNKADRDGADRVAREIRAMLETQFMLKKGQTVPAGPDTLASRFEEVAHHRQLAPRAGQEPAAEPAVPAGAALDPHAGIAEIPDLPPVIKTIAETGAFVEQAVDAVITHYRAARESGALAERRLGSARFRLRQLAAARALRRLEAGPGAEMVDSLAHDVVQGVLDMYSAAGRLYDSIH